jgi:regulator of cell morphogenesis and NO signaling
MNITSHTRVGDIVRENFNAASVLTRMKIDYCCGGNRTLEAACTESGADLEKVIWRLDRALKIQDHQTGYVQSMPPDQLCDHIIRQHHGYVRNKIPVLTAGIEKLCNVHGQEHPELFRVKELFWVGTSNLIQHMQKEEMILFPYIKHMIFCGKTHSPLNPPAFGSIVNPLQMLISEHEGEGERFRTISEITGSYSVPPDGCETFRITYGLMAEFEEDLHKHIHLENNVLFPEALEMEHKLLGK